MYYNKDKALKEFISIKGNQIYINQTAQITDNSALLVNLKIHTKKPSNGTIYFKPYFVHQ